MILSWWDIYLFGTRMMIVNFYDHKLLKINILRLF